MNRTLLCAALLIVILIQGCTLHFKATDLEFDAERQRVESNHTYNLRKVVLLDG